jgi:hypothetical protein
MDEWMDGWMVGWRNEGTKERYSEGMNLWINILISAKISVICSCPVFSGISAFYFIWMIGCLDGWLDDWMVEGAMEWWLDGWMVGWLNVERSYLPRSIGEIPPLREMIERLNFKRVSLPRLYASIYNQARQIYPDSYWNPRHYRYWIRNPERMKWL